MAYPSSTLTAIAGYFQRNIKRQFGSNPRWQGNHPSKKTSLSLATMIVGLLIFRGEFPLAPDKETAFHDGNVEVVSLDPREIN